MQGREFRFSIAVYRRNKAYLAQIKELENMLKHILRFGLKRLKLQKMASIISCWLFSPRISPQSIFKQVLGLQILNHKFPEDVPNSC